MILYVFALGLRGTVASDTYFNVMAGRFVDESTNFKIINQLAGCLMSSL